MSSLFNLRSANRIANLTCGRITAVYDDIYYSYENYRDFLASLDYCMRNLCVNEMASFRNQILRAKTIIADNGYPDRTEKNRSAASGSEAEAVAKRKKREILAVLEDVAAVFSEYPVKAIFLPQVRYTEAGYNDDFITTKTALRQLATANPECTPLILQPRERPYIDRVTIFDTFPYFEIALRQLEHWPAVLFWDHEKEWALLIPVADDEELSHVFALACQGEGAHKALEAYAQKKLPPSHYYLQLSDLHFGGLRTQRYQPPLESAITQQISTLNTGDTMDFIITGDIVDSPTLSSIRSLGGFLGFLDENSHEEPMYVLGNHDINTLGLALGHRNQEWTHIESGYPKLRIVEDIGVIFMLFNSNTSGKLAQGEIGKAQMAAMDDLLSRVKDLERYTLVAVLHHHVTASSYFKHIYGNEQWREEVGKHKGLDKFRLLKDAESFMSFLKKHHTRFVLHGHKHVPLVIDNDGIYIIACGSSVGHFSNYVSYNMLKFSNRVLTCCQFVEELPTATKEQTNIMTIAIGYK